MGYESTQERNIIHTPKDVPKSCRFVFWGAAAGLIAGLAVLFSSSCIAAITAAEPASCAAVGSFMTLALSYPVAVAGVAVGAACGGVCAMVGCCVDRFRSTHQ
jgi:hypothetical protein